ncbi:MAG TPA: hypothetical protein VMW27_07215 [Thermoanaerobaculia bacterium]|nr:hypothetical protein [Thermoanaerobaculia bacterium]
MPDRNAIPRTAEPQAKPGLKLRIEEKLGLLDPVQIQVFRSFGVSDLLQIRGRDPETYLDIVEKHPGRVKAIYIRDVSPPERDQEVRAIAERLEDLGVPMLRMENTLQAAEHAAEQGYISRESLEEVRKEVERQEASSQS